MRALVVMLKVASRPWSPQFCFNTSWRLCFLLSNSQCSLMLMLADTVSLLCGFMRSLAMVPRFTELCVRSFGLQEAEAMFASIYLWYMGGVEFVGRCDCNTLIY